MRKNYSFIFILSIMLIIACEKEPNINFGFDAPIEKNSVGLVIADITQHTEEIYLNGYINLSVGAVEVSLIKPNGNAVYSETIHAPIELNINESFVANSGYWKLKYKSREGVGKIDLHLQKN